MQSNSSVEVIIRGLSRWMEGRGPPSSFPIYFGYHPQVEPTEEGPEGKAAEVFSIEVKGSKHVRKYYAK